MTRALPVEFWLFDKPGGPGKSLTAGAGFRRNISQQVRDTWVHSVRRIGGYWLATCEYRTSSASEMMALFMDGITREVQATVGGQAIFEGFLAEAVLRLDGQEYRRGWGDIANKVKVIYSRIGDNQFTNGSAESGAWTAYGTPTTLEQSTTWVSDGTYSCHIITDATNEGATIQTGITIVASKSYDCRVSVSIISGTWVLEIYRTDTGAALGSATNTQTGNAVMRASVGDNNPYAGTIGVRLYCTDAAGEIYADGAVFQ